MARKEDYLIIAKVIALAWQDEAYKKRFLAHPVEVLREEGLEVPEGWRVKVVQDTPTLKHIALPVKPIGLSAKEMEDYAVIIRCSVVA
jgi:nitrile hydratase alpha subunit